MKDKLIKIIIPLLFIIGVIKVVNYATEYDTGGAKTFFQITMYFSLCPVYLEAGRSIVKTIKS